MIIRRIAKKDKYLLDEGIERERERKTNRQADRRTDRLMPIRKLNPPKEEKIFSAIETHRQF